MELIAATVMERVPTIKYKMYCSSVKYPIDSKYQNRQWLYVGTVGFLFINKNCDQGLKMLFHSPKLLSNYVDLLKMHIALNNCSKLQQMFVFIQFVSA